jgi:hypothetical protein
MRLRRALIRTAAPREILSNENDLDIPAFLRRKAS